MKNHPAPTRLLRRRGAPHNVRWRGLPPRIRRIVAARRATLTILIPDNSPGNPPTAR